MLLGFQFVYAQVDSLLLVIQQNKPSDKIHAYFELGRRFSRNIPDSALWYLNEGISLAEKEKDKHSMIPLFLVKGNILRDQGKFPLAHDAFERWYELANHFEGNKAFARYYYNYGILLKKQGK